MLSTSSLMCASEYELYKVTKPCLRVISSKEIIDNSDSNSFRCHLLAVHFPVLKKAPPSNPRCICCKCGVGAFLQNWLSLSSLHIYPLQYVLFCFIKKPHQNFLQTFVVPQFFQFPIAYKTKVHAGQLLSRTAECQ